MKGYVRRHGCPVPVTGCSIPVRNQHRAQLHAGLIKQPQVFLEAGPGSKDTAQNRDNGTDIRG